MQLHVTLFGILKDLTKSPAGLSVEVPEGSTASDLWNTIRSQHPSLERYERSVAIAVNHEFAEPSRVLTSADVVALLPPVSGGASEPAQSTAPVLPVETPHARIQRDIINSVRLLQEVKTGEDGAVCLFDGIVRNNTRGRRTLYLEYDGYVEMAIQQMEALALEAIKNFSVRDVKLVHRLGTLQIAESSVVIVVSSAHRGAAFDACRWLIDTLKKKVPIWKKEFFEDGAVWADGDPFPPEVPTL